MRNPFQPGDLKVYETEVGPGKLATFGSSLVHPVYATFALAQDAEWACRLFVLDMKEEGEEGIGTALSIEHLSPALAGERIRFEARLERVEGSRVDCAWTASCGSRLIARGTQAQRILPRSRLEAIFATLRQDIA
jgi:predicted thioesterase